MKKLIGLSAAFFLITATVISQDTIPTAKQNLPNSTKTDTIPNVNKWNKDTSALGRANTQKGDTSMKSNSPDSALANNNNKWPDSTAATANTPTGQDSAAQANTLAKADSMSGTKTVVEDKVIMMDEKVYVIKNGDSTLLSDSLTLPSGAVVKSDASVRFRDGSVTKLKNGQYISIKPAPAETSKPDTTSASASSSTTTTTTATTTTATTATKAAVEDKVVMIDDKVMLVQNGDSTELADSIKLKSGAVVKKDGSVRFKNGSTTQLKNGQFIDLNPEPAETKKTTKSKKTSKKKTS